MTAKTKRTTKPKAAPKVYPYHVDAWVALFQKLGIAIGEDEGALYLGYDQSTADETAVEAFVQFYRQAPKIVAVRLAERIDAKEDAYYRRYLNEPRQRRIGLLALPK